MRFRDSVHEVHKDFYVRWGILTNFQFCIEIFQLSVWWYDFHIMILILYDDGILLLFLMIGRREMIPWDPGILGNDIFPKGAVVFGSWKRSQWDQGILLSYLYWVENFVVIGGHLGND